MHHITYCLNPCATIRVATKITYIFELSKLKSKLVLIPFFFVSLIGLFWLYLLKQAKYDHLDDRHKCQMTAMQLNKGETFQLMLPFFF